MSVNKYSDEQYGYTAANRNDDYEQLRFGEINERDLFWLSNVRSDSNAAWRKLDEEGFGLRPGNGKGQNTKTGEIRDFKSSDMIFQRS